MKLFFVSVALLAMTSCTKDWECCVTQTISGHPANNAGLNGTNVYCIDFRGTNEEKNEFEASGTQVLQEDAYPLNYTYTITQSTECVPD